MFVSLLQGLIRDTDKLQSYIDHALIPWVEAVKDHPALGGWDVINELEGVIIPGERSDEPCFDTQFLSWSTAGFAEELYRAEELLRFVHLLLGGLLIAAERPLAPRFCKGRGSCVVYLNA